MQLKTINIVETINADTPTIHSFPLTKSGKFEAKLRFIKIAQDQETTWNILPIEKNRKLFTRTEIKEGFKARGLNSEDGSWTLQVIESQ